MVQHMYELEKMVEDTIDTEHMRIIVPLIGMAEDVAINAARVIAQEFVVTACLGYDGDPSDLTLCTSAFSSMTNLKSILHSSETVRCVPLCVTSSRASSPITLSPTSSA